MNKEMLDIQNQIEKLNNKMLRIENKVSRLDTDKDFNYQKVLSAIKYLYRYYDDMNKEKDVEITS